MYARSDEDFLLGQVGDGSTCLDNSGPATTVRIPRDIRNREYPDSKVNKIPTPVRMSQV